MTASGEGLGFEIRQPPCVVDIPPPASDAPSVMAFSHHKAGSTMFFDILRAVCPAAGLTFVSVQDQLFRRGIDAAMVDVKAEFGANGYCFGGFRNFPPYPVPLIDHARTILLVRDPRDAIVSLYFSWKLSHVPPGREGSALDNFIAGRAIADSMTLDDWALTGARRYVESIAGYMAQGFHRRPNVKIFRYEDVIFRKRAWLDEIADWYGWDLPEKLKDRAVSAVDIVPPAPDPTKHIRQVHPGNHKELIKPATIERLNSELNTYLTLFGYRD